MAGYAHQPRQKLAAFHSIIARAAPNFSEDLLNDFLCARVVIQDSERERENKPFDGLFSTSYPVRLNALQDYSLRPVGRQ